MDQLNSNKDSKINYGLIKIGAYFLVGVILALLLANQLSAMPNILDAGELVALGVFVLLWIVAVSLAPLIVQNRSLAAFLFLIQTAAIWYFSSGEFSVFPATGALALFLLLLTSFFRGREELKSRVEIKFTHVAASVSKIALTGLAIFLSLLFLRSLNLPQMEIPKSTFEFFFIGSDSAIREFIPGFSMNSSVEAVLKDFVRSRMPGASQEKINVEAGNLINELSASLAVKLDPREKVIDAVYRASLAWLNGLDDGLKLWTAIILGFFAFSVLKFIAFFLNWLAVALSFIVYQLLIAFNFIKIGFETVNKENIIVS